MVCIKNVRIVCRVTNKDPDVVIVEDTAKARSNRADCYEMLVRINGSRGVDNDTLISFFAGIALAENGCSELIQETAEGRA